MKKTKLYILGFLLLLGLMLTTACGKKQSSRVRVGALKGPTTIGLLSLMENAETNRTDDEYSFQMATGADELLAAMVQGNLDIALVPANVAAVAYTKTQGKVCAIDINTLGVLYVVSADESLQDIADLSGRTIYLTGKGTTPDCVLQYVLEQNGITDCKAEFKTEATEVAAMLEKEPEAVALLPQPFVTAACMQNPDLQIRLSMNDEWKKVTGEENMVTGVTICTKDFCEKNPESVKRFLEEHENSVQTVLENPTEAAALCVKQGIVAKEGIAAKAIPMCNITCIKGADMKKGLSGYLQILYEKNPEMVGGVLPEDDFYYVAK